MRVTSIKTAKILPGMSDIQALLDQALQDIQEKDVLAIASKVVSLCENNVVPLGDAAKDELVIQESDAYLPHELSKYGLHFTVTDNTLIPMAGIDESNGNGNYVLWPKNAQKSANEVRRYLVNRFGIRDVGVVITDSTCQPLRRGTTGIALAYSGFLGLNDYVGTPDLFGRPFSVSQSNVAGGLAAAAVLVMGEGTEQTPLCVLSDLPFVQFQERDPSPAELALVRIPLEEDLFAPFLGNVTWRQGRRKAD